MYPSYMQLHCYYNIQKIEFQLKNECHKCLKYF